MAGYIQLINKSEDYIEANLYHKITLEDIANHVHISKYHYHKIFKKYAKETAQEFINRIKLERSAIFLKVNPTISMTEIAHRYGYYDASAYCKAFKKRFKQTPTEFRKQQDNTINPKNLGI